MYLRGRSFLRGRYLGCTRLRGDTLSFNFIPLRPGRRHGRQISRLVLVGFGRSRGCTFFAAASSFAAARFAVFAAARLASASATCCCAAAESCAAAASFAAVTAAARAFAARRPALTLSRFALAADAAA